MTSFRATTSNSCSASSSISSYSLEHSAHGSLSAFKATNDGRSTDALASIVIYRTLFSVLLLLGLVVLANAVIDEAFRYATVSEWDGEKSCSMASPPPFIPPPCSLALAIVDNAAYSVSLSYDLFRFIGLNQVGLLIGAFCFLALVTLEAAARSSSTFSASSRLPPPCALKRVPAHSSTWCAIALGIAYSDRF